MSLLPIVRAARAEDDLIGIWLHIAHDNEVAADRLLDRFEARWQQLATYPFSGAPRDDFAPGIRHLVVSDYLTLYRSATTRSRSFACCMASARSKPMT
ncbi:type II toxin-antitoxin system RelE/ParE family toxin [Mesorhizobium sp. M7A.F.Ca.US.008.03.1.1]|uniref:type II toxin-antitoxin system RelE/ParE family toxin n=1 Tax=Mesorhizobium sp. M7A.F.Ca.US.008.03.1.1 TaxID=2496742 RepID=UPI001FE0A3D4|nr:type II toxin-antitoxin system RelE/ParE family toxin [Mesorhizobium sp. M7A.F.Ca.US.008.03.1.1]